LIESDLCFHFFKRGLGKKKEEKPFREAYSKIGNIRAVTEAPMLCLTATASRAMRKNIIKLLNMKNVKIVRLPPNKDNIKMSFQKAPKELEETLSWVIGDLKEKGNEMLKTIIYCRSLKDCGDIYCLFNEKLSTRTNYAMYHSKTPAKIQEKVLASLLDPDGEVRLVIATSALGLGVNIPNVRWVIHYGIPMNVEDYVQEIGRAGRDGLQSYAIMYYRPYHLARCDKSMRRFVKNADAECRREMVADYFKESSTNEVESVICCDQCGGVEPQSTQTTQGSTCTMHPLSRAVDEEDKLLLKETLRLIPENPKKRSIFGTSSFVNLTETLIEDIVESACYVFTVDFIINNFAIFDSWLAHEILTVFNEIFDDISETEFLKAANLEDYWENDDLDESIPEWCFSLDSDSEDSD